jgi:hypothetical protein
MNVSKSLNDDTNTVFVDLMSTAQFILNKDFCFKLVLRTCDFFKMDNVTRFFFLQIINGSDLSQFLHAHLFCLNLLANLPRYLVISVVSWRCARPDVRMHPLRCRLGLHPPPPLLAWGGENLMHLSSPVKETVQ